jgi:DNA-binding transcriptional ArsR family regulator
MKLLDFLFKTEEHKKLAQLVWVEGIEASVRRLSLMSGLSYATAYEELHRMEETGLVKQRVDGKATLFSSNLSDGERAAFASLFNYTFKQKTSKPLSDRLQELGLPMVGDLSALRNETVQDDEELVVKAVCKAKGNPTLARSLPVVLVNVLPNVNPHRLHFWANKNKVKKELGFFIALTAHLSNEPALKKMAKLFFDKRWSKPEYFLETEKGARGFQARLVESNTPSLAKTWKLKMNLGLDSFESLFNKFVTEEKCRREKKVGTSD